MAAIFRLQREMSEPNKTLGVGTAAGCSAAQRCHFLPPASIRVVWEPIARLGSGYGCGRVAAKAGGPGLGCLEKTGRRPGWWPGWSPRPLPEGLGLVPLVSGQSHARESGGATGSPPSARGGRTAGQFVRCAPTTLQAAPMPLSLGLACMVAKGSAGSEPLGWMGCAGSPSTPVLRALRSCPSSQLLGVGCGVGCGAECAWHCQRRSGSGFRRVEVTESLRGAVGQGAESFPPHWPESKQGCGGVASLTPTRWSCSATCGWQRAGRISAASSQAQAQPTGRCRRCRPGAPQTTKRARRAAPPPPSPRRPPLPPPPPRRR